MKKILLIGGEGYIGKSLQDFFLKKKFQIISFDNLIYGQKFTRKKKEKNLKFIKGDIRNNKDVKNILKIKYDAIVLLAGLVGDPITKKYKTLSKSINKESLIKLIKKIYLSENSKKFIFISTCSNYGLSKSKYLTETNKLRPLSHYARCKVDVEKFIFKLKKKNSFNPTILRFATAFGLSDRMRYDLTINQFVFELYKKGFIQVYDFNTWRPYCHVKDFARLINKVISAKNSLTSFQIFNAGGNKNNFTKKKIAYTIRDKIGGKIELLKKTQDKRNYIVDFSKVKKILNFIPKYSVSYGVTEILRNLKMERNKKINYKKLGNFKINKK